MIYPFNKLKTSHLWIHIISPNNEVQATHKTINFIGYRESK